MWLVGWIACQPTGLSVEISPSAPTGGDDLVAEPADGDWTYRWSVDGVEVDDLVGNVVPAGRTSRGETWRVEVTSRGRSADAEVTILNTPPTASLTLPQPLPREGTLSAELEVADADGDELTITWAWLADGELRSTSPTVPAGALGGGQVVTVTALVSDGLDEVTAEAEANVPNTAPLVDSVRIEPEAPSSSDTLTAVWTAFDPDPQPLDAVVTWEVNGKPVTQAPTLPPTFFSRDDVVRVLLTPTDGVDSGPSVRSGEVRIGNGPPTADAASVSPGALAEGIVAGCVLDGAGDPDGDGVEANVRWFVNGTLAGTFPALTSASFDEGDEVVCEATPTDGALVGSPLTSTAALVLNSPPVVGVLRFVPLAPTALDVLTVQDDGTYDPDGDPVETELRWYVDGVDIGVRESIDGMVRGQSIQAELTAWDGTVEGSPIRTSVVVVGNAPPSARDLAWSPDPPTANADLTATCEPFDADGDAVTVTYRWFADGALAHDGNPLPAGTVSVGQLVAFEVTVSDGTLETVVRSDEAPVEP